MKKVFVTTALLVFALATPLVAQDDDSATVDLNPGDVTVSASVGFGYGFSLALYPGIEVFVAEQDLDGGVNLDFGVAAKGLYNRYSTSYAGDRWGWNTFGLGGFGTAHLSVVEDDVLFDGFDRFDFYIGLGLVYSAFDYFGPYDDRSYLDYSGFGFSSIGGLNYYLSDHVALVFEGTYWGYAGGTIGVLYKF
ncbi:MAG: hypothetical protein R6V29_11850 [Spirochaetia bacterium]